MKKIVVIFLCLVYILSMCGCATEAPEKEYVEEKDSLRAVWLSYYEYDIKGLDYEGFQIRINEIFDNVKKACFNTIIVHIRANADALYKSEYFPLSDILTGSDGQAPEYDPLEYMVTAAHERGLKLHAWVNPFRVSNKTDDIATLDEDHIARIWYESSETKYRVIPYGDKIYFNPSSTEVRELIVNGIREIAENYDVDGIHIDDYFYPTDNADFDQESYNLYLQNTASPLSLTEWRTANISTLISEIYKVTQKNNIELGISPSAHIGLDYLVKNGYADVKEWLKTAGYADYIIPQIYWGFEYADKEYRFDNILSDWVNLKRNKNIKLCPGIAAYKIGTEDTNNEWIENSDILKKQVKLIEEKGCDSFAVFSYSYLFSEENQNALERENLINVLKEKAAN